MFIFRLYLFICSLDSIIEKESLNFYKKTVLKKEGLTRKDNDKFQQPMISFRANELLHFLFKMTFAVQLSIYIWKKD